MDEEGRWTVEESIPVVQVKGDGRVAELGGGGWTRKGGSAVASLCLLKYGAQRTRS